MGKGVQWQDWVKLRPDFLLQAWKPRESLEGGPLACKGTHTKGCLTIRLTGLRSFMPGSETSEPAAFTARSLLVPHQATFALFGCGFCSKGRDRSTGGG